MHRKVLLVNSAVYLPGEGGYKRTMYLFNMLRNMGYQTTLLTSDFNHYAKRQRDIVKFRKDYPEYSDIKFLHLKPYKKNISLKRYFHSKKNSKLQVKWILDHLSDYEVLYFNMPGSYIITHVAEYIDKHNLDIPIIVDVRDLRPEALRVKIKNNFLYKVLTFRMKLAADRAYACADELLAVSREYLDRALQINKKAKRPTVVYIGAILELFEEGVKEYGQSIKKQDGEFWLTYAGTIGASYDLKTAIDAMEIITKQATNVRLKILGQGPDRNYLESYAKRLQLPVDFLGFVEYKIMAAYLVKSDICLNAIKKRASQSIINKVADYYAAGIPMLNCCQCEEQLWLNEHYNAGLNYKPENVSDLVDKFFQLYNNKEVRETMGKNAKKLALEKFDRKRSYMEIIEIIDNASKKY